MYSPSFLRFLVTALVALLPWMPAAAGQGNHLLQGDSFLQSTYLVELQQGSELSERMSNLQGGSYETADGRSVTFQRWYRTRWTDARATWLTQVTPEFGVLWGLSTGEHGEKYEIQPSLKLGFAFQTSIDKHSSFSLKATTIVGGRLKEKPCAADYGEVGGVQSVNCRLAASEMPPAETLNHLLNYAPVNRNVVFLQYRRTF